MFKRSYHISSLDKAIQILFINCKAFIVPFEDSVVSVCSVADLLSSNTILKTFFSTLKSKGGIYMFTLKSNPDIFYIGRAKDFQKRFKSHLLTNISLNDRFHTFANNIGWDKFDFSIIEICDLNLQQNREIFLT